LTWFWKAGDSAKTGRLKLDVGYRKGSKRE
jgi:hypothetical protein